MNSHIIDIHIRMSETNASGHVSNTSYYIYLDDARSQFFDAVGFGSGEQQMSFVLASCYCDFLQEVFFGQILQVETTVSKIGTKSYTLQHQIIDRATGSLVAKAQSVVFCFNHQNKQSVAIPDALYEGLKRYESNNQFINPGT
ncbi:acyl-CoA thioesterase [Peribacillus asahii]|uniref:Acyl-CoA thioesterase n=1 Tax=Peribacillus asahii TaxID=228899 RepID=A0A398BDX4_9BACI|nr:thioesterase family protein [Peribacillus asahii]RID87018.1 acyl-CoA thioesterase [Peribacillus asahii]